MSAGENSVFERLLGLDLFQQVDASCREAILKQASTRTIEPGACLFDVDEISQALFVVLEGEIHLELPREASDDGFLMQVRSRGHTLGDFAFINRSRHLVRSMAPNGAVVAELPPALFEQMGESDPGIRVTVYDAATDLARRVMLAQLYIELFESVEVKQMQMLLDATTVGHCRGGDTLFDVGDPSDGLRFVVSGRLVTEQQNAEGRVEQVGEYRGPSIVGAVDALADSPQQSRLLATRASVYAHLPRDAFRSIVLEDASLVTNLTRHTLRRYARHGTENTGAPGRLERRSIALLSLTDKVLDSSLLRRLRRMLTENVTLQWCDATDFEKDFGVEGAGSTRFDDLLDHSVSRWLDEFERRFDLSIYVGRAGRSAWTERIINRADRIVWVAEAGADPESAREAYRELLHTFGDPSYLPSPELILLHPADTERPTGTWRWLDFTGVGRVHHVRSGDVDHVRSLARRLSGEERGLVLSSGGARGYAHLGAQRLFEERGYKVDHVGGTSMGALLGAAMAMGYDHDYVSRLSHTFARRSALFDYTLPLVSVMRSRRLTRFCKHVCSDVNIEDLWTPYFSVSANLGDGSVVVHQRGPLWKAVRSSISLPGLFSPVPNETGRLLVDGAVLNGFPVNVMRERLGGAGLVIGIDVGVLDEPMHRFTFGAELSGWRVLLSRLSPFHTRIAAPKVIETLLRSTDVKDVERKAEQRRGIDVLVSPDVSAWNLLDFKQYRDISDVGYEATRTVFDALKLSELDVESARRVVDAADQAPSDAPPASARADA